MSGRSNIRAALLERHLGPATSLATHLIEDPQAARSLAEDAFAGCFARLAYLREPQDFELGLFTTIVSAARRRARRDPCFEEKAVYHLHHHEEMSVAAIAGVLGQPDAKIEALLEGKEKPETGLEVPDLTSPPAYASFVRVRRRSLLKMLMIAAVGLIVLAFVSMTTLPGPPRQVPVFGFERSLPDILMPQMMPEAPPVVVARGSAGGVPWVMRAYRAQQNAICFELRVAEEYGDAHCLLTFGDPFRVFVAPDRLHSMTFLFGFTKPSVASLSAREGAGRTIEVELFNVPVELERRPVHRMFLTTLPGYALPLADRSQGRRNGYAMTVVELTARSASGRRLASDDLLLGVPR